MKLSIIVLIVRDAKSCMLKAYAVQRDAEGVLNIGRNILSGKQITKVGSARVCVTEALRGKYSRLEFC